MSSSATRFNRQLRSEMTFVRTDRSGQITLLLGLILSVLWGVFLSYLTIVYQVDSTKPSPRVPAGGLAQCGYFAIMLWAVLLLLGSKSKGFWNMRVLVEPSRPIITLATMAHLTLWSTVYAVLGIALATPIGIGVVTAMGYDPSPLYGAPGEIGVLMVQMIGLSVGSAWFAAGCALVFNSIGTATTVVILWPLILEGMLPNTGFGATLKGIMPFVNGLAWFQGDKDLMLPWPQQVGFLYFLVLTLIFALFGVWVRRNETMDRTT